MNKELDWRLLYAPMDGQGAGLMGDQNAARPTFLSHGPPCSKLELSISARDLRNLDTFSLSDPQCVVFIRDSPQQPYREIGRTETVKDSLNPHFVRKIMLDFNFEMVQQLRFDLWDIDIRENDFLGSVETSLPEIVANKSREFTRPITCGKRTKGCGTLVLVVEELSTCKQIVHLDMSANDLQYGFFCFSKPSAFIRLWRSNEDGSFSLVHQTPSVWRTRCPHFKPITIKASTLCNGDFDRNIRIELMQEKLNGNHKLIGRTFASLNHMLSNENLYDVKDEANRKRGQLRLNQIKLENAHSFFDFIRSGLEIHFAVAIDFTYSNGLVDNPGSLHYLEPLGIRPNQYEIALRAVGEIIQYYNSTKMFPGFGFGAKLPPNDRVSHLFPLNGDITQPYCEGVEQLLMHYKRILCKVTLSGPTNFAPVIDYTAQIASKNANPRNYFILLIITDGIICDMPQTIRSLIRASSLPLSVIIVGVGNADFSAMDQLDADSEPLQMDGKKAVRDIVQFVPLNRFVHEGQHHVQAQGELAREILYEVPEQVESLMKLRGWTPENVAAAPKSF